MHNTANSIPKRQKEKGEEKIAKLALSQIRVQAHLSTV